MKPMRPMSSEQKRIFQEISYVIIDKGPNASVTPEDIRGKAAVAKDKILEYLSLFASRNLYATEDGEHFFMTGIGKHEFSSLVDIEYKRGGTRTVY